MALPEVLDFVPALLVEVFDTRGLRDVKVAGASVPLSSFVPWGPVGNKLPLYVLA